LSLDVGQIIGQDYRSVWISYHDLFPLGRPTHCTPKMLGRRASQDGSFHLGISLPAHVGDNTPGIFYFEDNRWPTICRTQPMAL
jgi:hypothetical protein